jgi:hypothetical protein
MIVESNAVSVREETCPLGKPKKAIMERYVGPVPFASAGRLANVLVRLEVTENLFSYTTLVRVIRVSYYLESASWPTMVP